ncbi:LOW QUALITY PROTEIN: deoxyuridine 5'-triphosphate nucleotidohydrolase, partial [Mycobacterium tuberculosis T85]
MSTTLAIVRLDPGLPLPSRAHDGDAGVDLYSAEDVELAPGRRALVRTGVAVAVPFGMVGLVHPRSGLATRVGLSIVNSPGTIDAGYRGEIKVALINLDPAAPIVVHRGDRIAQLLVHGLSWSSWSRSRRSTRPGWPRHPAATVATVPPADMRVC